MLTIEDMNKCIKKTLDVGASENDLQKLLWQAEVLFNERQANMEKDDIIPYELLLLEHNILKLKDILQVENTNTYGRSR